MDETTEAKTGFKPAVVGALRGAIEAGVVAAIGFLAATVNAFEAPDQWKWVIPGVIFGLRTAEGFVDQKIDPSVQRGKLGGGPATPADQMPAH